MFSHHGFVTRGYAVGVPAFVVVLSILEHRLHLFLGRGGKRGGGLVTVGHCSWRRGRPTDGRSGPSFHLLFLLQLIGLQVHVRGGHGALHVRITAAGRHKQASLSSLPLFLEAREACSKYSSFDQGLTWTQH